MELYIRPLQKADAASYRDCRLNALRLAPSAFSSSYRDAVKLPMSHFEERATFQAHSFIYGAFEEDLLVGSAGGFVETQEKRRHIGHVVGMWVEPEFRGQHLARRLLTAVLTQFRTQGSVRSVQLGVTRGNQVALTLYESVGFTKWGEEPDAILVDGASYDQLHMVLPL